MRRFFAPAKLMLAGEYSVLAEDGLALAVAVHGGVEVSAEPATCWGIERAESGLAWTEGQGQAEAPAELHFACAALWQALRRAPGTPPHALRTRSLAGTSESSLPDPARGGGAAFPAGALGGASGGALGGRSADAVSDAGKPGLGGSASASAAVSVAVLSLGGHSLDGDRHRGLLLEVALAAHAQAQAGQGSGYDVATVVYGGLLRWHPASGEARRLAWPPGLGILAGYSGGSASTTGLLGRLAARPADSAARELRRLVAPAACLVGAFEAGQTGAILEVAHATQLALCDFDRALGLGVITPAIARMVALAESVGVAAKVSGAGGGDSVIALADDPARLARVADLWREAGFLPLMVERDDQGTRELSQGSAAFRPRNGDTREPRKRTRGA